MTDDGELASRIRGILTRVDEDAELAEVIRAILDRETDIDAATSLVEILTEAADASWLGCTDAEAVATDMLAGAGIIELAPREPDAAWRRAPKQLWRLTARGRQLLACLDPHTPR